MMNEVTLLWIELFIILTIVLQVVALVFSISTNYRHGQIQKAQKIQQKRFKTSLSSRQATAKKQGQAKTVLPTDERRHQVVDPRDEIHMGYKM